jgi:hypothetical protein
VQFYEKVRVGAKTIEKPCDWQIDGIAEPGDPHVFFPDKNDYLKLVSLESIRDLFLDRFRREKWIEISHEIVLPIKQKSLRSWSTSRGDPRCLPHMPMGKVLGA